MDVNKMVPEGPPFDIAAGECPQCGQNGWLANNDDGELTICENCGWDVDAEGYIEGRG